MKLRMVKAFAYTTALYQPVFSTGVFEPGFHTSSDYKEYLTIHVSTSSCSSEF